MNPTLRRGYTVTTITAKFDYARAMALQPYGKIVVHGTTSDGQKDYVALVRYNSNGTLDLSFGAGGIVILGRTRNTPYDMTIEGPTNNYHLLNGFLLGGNAGPGPKKTADVTVNRKFGGNPFKPFGTWHLTF